MRDKFQMNNQCIKQTWSESSNQSPTFTLPPHAVTCIQIQSIVGVRLGH